MPTGIIFIIVLSILVLVHELGHFMAAKLLGIRVEEFAFGLPFTKPILSIKRGETAYSIYPLLFGGFVRVYGEEQDVAEDKKRSYWNRNKLQRLLVLTAGVIMNMVLAFTAFVFLYSRVGIPRLSESKITVLAVADNSPAKKAGIRENDRIVAIENKKLTATDEFSRVIKTWAGVEVNVTIERGKGIPLFEGIVEKNTQTLTYTMVPRSNPPKNEGALGVEIAEVPYLITDQCSVTSIKCVDGAINQGVKSTEVWIGRVFEGLRTIGKSLSQGKAPEGVSGPVGIYQITGIVAAEGWQPLMELVAILSINLAVFNILPIPALDGGRVFFLMLETVLRKRIPAEIEQKVNSWGMAVLISLMVLVSLQDVIKMDWFQRLLGR